MKMQIKAALERLGFLRYFISVTRFFRLYFKTVHFSESYVVEFNSVKVSFLTDTPYTKWWFHRNRKNGMHNGWHEPPVTFLLEDLARASSDFVDVGSHLGYFSILFSSISEHQSLAIEFDPSNLEELKRAVAFQPPAVRERIDVVHCGISNTADIIYLPAKRALSPVRSISATTKSEGSQVAVEIMTLDDVIRSRGFTPDIVKIDVEGWEVNVLNGATKTIHVFKPILIIEIHPTKMRNIGHNQEMVSLFLRDHGYLIYAFDDHRAKGFSPLIEVCKLTKAFNNDIVCIHKDDVRLFSLTATRLAALNNSATISPPSEAASTSPSGPGST